MIYSCSSPLIRLALAPAHPYLNGALSSFLTGERVAQYNVSRRPTVWRPSPGRMRSRLRCRKEFMDTEPSWGLVTRAMGAAFEVQVGLRSLTCNTTGNLRKEAGRISSPVV